MTKTKIRNEIYVKDCNIYGMCESDCVFTAKCKAKIETKTHEKTLRTKDGVEYIVSRKEYGLVIGKYIDTDATFDSIDEVEYYNALFVFRMPNGVSKEYRIENIVPVHIDLAGDWIFKISDMDGQELCSLYDEARS